LFAPNFDKPEGAFLRILEFSIERAALIGWTMRYRLEAGADGCAVLKVRAVLESSADVPMPSATSRAA
jgi:hypothetical protein